MAFRFLLASLSCLSTLHCSMLNAETTAREEGTVGTFTESFGRQALVAPDVDHLPASERRVGEAHVNPPRNTRMKNIKTSWTEYQAAVNSLYHDSQELQMLLNGLKGDHYHMLVIRKRTASEATLKDLAGRTEMLERIEDLIKIFKQKRLIQLRGYDMPKSNEKLVNLLLSIDDNIKAKGTESASLKILSEKSNAKLKQGLPKQLPDDLVNEIDTRMWKALGDSIVEDLQKLIRKDEYLSSAKLGSLGRTTLQVKAHKLNLQKTVLKTIDFLVKNSLTSPEKVRLAFQDPQVVERLMLYIFHQFKGQGEMQDIDFASPFITEHWYWPLSHDSFNVLTKKEEQLINTSCLLTRLRVQFESSPPYYTRSPEWGFLMESFQINRFGKMFKALDSNIDRKIQNDDLEEFRRDVLKIIDILLMPGDPALLEGSKDMRRESLDATLVDIWDLIEKYLYPGLTKDILHEHPRSQEFLDRASLIRFSSKFFSLSNKLLGYLASENKSLAERAFEKNVHKAKIDDYVNQLKELGPEFKEALRQIREKNDHTSEWSQHQWHITSLDKRFDQDLYIYRRSAKRFME